MFLVHAAAFFGRAQTRREVSVEWIFSPERSRIEYVPSWTWTSDGDLVILDQSAEDPAIVRLNPASGRIIARAPLADLAAGLQEKGVFHVPGWPLSFDVSARQALYAFDGDLFLLDLKTARVLRLTNTSEPEQSARLSPDGKRVAFVRSNDLFVLDLTTQQERRLTEDGSETVLNGTLGWMYWEEIYDREDVGFWWSPDSRRLAYLRTDESGVSLTHHTDFLPAVPRVLTQRYPKAGGILPDVRVGVVDALTGTTAWANVSPDTYAYIGRVQWLPGGQRLAIQTLNRAQTELRLYGVDASTGTPTLILTETDSAWINLHYDLHFIRGGREFIWLSERSGFPHLYRYETSGRLMNVVTQGPWSVRPARSQNGAVVHVDEKNGWVYYLSMETGSSERQLYRTRLDGSAKVRVSLEDGVHKVSFSPDGRYYVDEHSTAGSPPGLSLRKNDGSTVRVISAPRLDAVRDMGLTAPDFLNIPARDGFPLPARMIRPAGFDSSRKYPLIMHVYGGPGSPIVLNEWDRRVWFHQLLVLNGYVVVDVDNRSASAISKSLESTVLYDQAGDGELNDLVDAARWLKRLPYVDSSRIGVWGSSGGGTATLLVMTRSEEFRAGISVAPVTDWHYYDAKYAEATMKTPGANADGYARTSLMAYAGNLHGRLLMVHGTYDDNVHIQNTWHFADALIRAGKQFDLMVYPMRKHSFGDSVTGRHYLTLMLEFWKKNL